VVVHRWGVAIRDEADTQTTETKNRCHRLELDQEGRSLLRFFIRLGGGGEERGNTNPLFAFGRGKYSREGNSGGLRRSQQKTTDETGERSGKKVNINYSPQRTRK